LFLFVVLLLIVVSAVPALVSSYVARSGAALRMLGIAVIGADGREVSSLRGLARAVIAWTPGTAALVLLLPFATRGSLNQITLEQLAPSLVLLALFVGGAVLALVNPQRGVQDRMLRTSWLPDDRGGRGCVAQLGRHRSTIFRSAVAQRNIGVPRGAMRRIGDLHTIGRWAPSIE
jgi:hypothetical protein